MEEEKENGYLKISRSTGQSLKIGDNVHIAVSSFRRNKVILAIKAPREVKISRIDERFSNSKEKKIKALVQHEAINGN